MRTSPSSNVRTSAQPARLACAALPALFLASAASALVQEVATAPQPDRSMDLSSPVGGYALIAIMAAGVVLVNLMPSKRGHQD